MKFLLTGLLLLMMPGLAGAQTVLHLSESARVNVHPDELTASVKISASSISAAEAQNRVNGVVAKTLEQAKAVAGVSAATGNYQVWNSKQPEQWNAEQTIDLRSRDGAGLLRLVGVFQQQGLVLARLGWRVAPETARQARAEATRTALGNLRARADEAAGVIGMRFAAFRDVRLDGTPALAGPMPRTSLSAAPATTPSAEPDDVAVEALVEADVILQPGPPPPVRR
jgi:predicted secreted protein